MASIHEVRQSLIATPDATIVRDVTVKQYNERQGVSRDHTDITVIHADPKGLLGGVDRVFQNENILRTFDQLDKRGNVRAITVTVFPSRDTAEQVLKPKS